MLQIKQEVVKHISKADEFYKCSPFYTKGQLRFLCMCGVQLQEFLWRTSECVKMHSDSDMYLRESWSKCLAGERDNRHPLHP